MLRSALWLAGVFWLLGMSPARAYDFIPPDVYNPVTGHVCPISSANDGPEGSPQYLDNLKTYGIAERMVICVKESILHATYRILGPFSNYLSKTIAAAFSLALALWGMLLATGKNTAPMRDMALTFIKVGAVIMFTANFYGLYPRILDAMEYMLGVLTDYVLFSTSLSCTTGSVSYLLVWERVDCALEALIGGVLNPKTLLGGMAGFLLVSLFSGTAGLFIGAMGFMMIIQLLMAIARSVYIFITSYIAFSLMILISPLFVPLILFRVTKAFFEKWLRITIGFVLQPIFLIAYLVMLLAAFDTVVFSGSTSLYRTVAGDAAADPDFRLGNWMFDNGGYGSKSNAQYDFDLNPRKTRQELGIPETVNTGVLDTMGKYVVTPQTWNDKLESGELKFFTVDIPSETFDWVRMARKSNAACSGMDPPAWCYSNSAPDLDDEVTAYIVRLFMAFLMTLVTSYIFMSMLNFLPYIGSGISGEALTMPVFGSGRFDLPGSKFMNGLQDKLIGNFRRGKA